jgi:hypothetical protein
MQTWYRYRERYVVRRDQRRSDKSCEVPAPNTAAARL